MDFAQQVLITQINHYKIMRIRRDASQSIDLHRLFDVILFESRVDCDIFIFKVTLLRVKHAHRLDQSAHRFRY